MDKYLKDRIAAITEKDFWSSIRPGRELAEAIKAGKAGKRTAAYGLLSDYHAKHLVGETIAYDEKTTRQRGNAKSFRRLRAEAAKVLRHEIRGWHTRVIKFGDKIDFNADYGQSGQYGFHYLGWLVPVLDMYFATGEKKYGACLADIIGQYYAQRNSLVWRIPHLDPVYYELGAHAKATLLIPAYAVMARRRALDRQTAEAMLKLLLGFARSLYRLQANGYRRGNWQIVGCASLYRIGAAFPEFREAASWRKRAERILRRHAAEDFFTDGGHGERCWGYGYMSLGGIVAFYRSALLHRLMAEDDRKYWARFIKRCYRWFPAACTPSRHCLNYGDGEISGMDGIVAEAEGLFPELARHGGTLGVDRNRSNILKASGYAFMRNGDKPDAPFMSINFGKTGGGHTHSDLLDYTMWCFGRPLIEEVGRFGSYDNPLDPMFRSPSAHNQVVLEHMNMDRHNHEGRDVRWLCTPAVDMFSAWHAAYRAASIHRQIAFVKTRLSANAPCYWVINDVVTSKEYIFQTANILHSLTPFRAVGAGRFRPAGDPSCLVVEARPDEIRRSSTAVDYSREDFGVCQSLFGAERHRLCLWKWRDIGDARPIVFTTLLVPFRGRRPPAVRLTSAPAGNAPGCRTTVEVVYGRHRDVLVFNSGEGSVARGSGPARARMAVKTRGRWYCMSDR